MKYEEPLMEIIRFEFKNKVLAVSQENDMVGTENVGGENKDPIATDPGGDYDPFA